MALSSLGLLVIGSIPTVIGVAEAIDAQKKQNQQAKERIKFNLTAQFSVDEDAAPQTATVVFKDGKLYLDHPAHHVSGYRFNGFYFQYPGPENHQGLVSMASDDPPALHWIYADSSDGALRHGSRSTTAGHTIGPWSWSEDEEYLVLQESAQCFVAVEQADGSGWTLHYDERGDLDQALAPARGMVDVLLHRELQLGVSSKLVGSAK